MRTDNVWEALQQPAVPQHQPGHGPVRQMLHPVPPGGEEPHDGSADIAGTPEEWLAAPESPEGDPFAQWVAPSLLPLDDVSLGRADRLEGTGWHEAANPLGSYMTSGPLGVPSAQLARGRREFRRLEIMGGPAHQELTRSERLSLVRRQRWASVSFWIAAVLCLVLAIVTFAIDAADSAPSPKAGTEAAGRTTDGRTTLLLQRDGDALTSITLFVSSPGADKVLMIPTGVHAEVPGVGSSTLSAAGADPELAATVVSNLLGLRVDHWILTDSFGLQQLFGQIGGLSVDIPSDLVALRSAVHAGAGVDQGLLTRSFNFPAGTVQLDPEQAVAYLNAVTKDGDLARLARHADLWKAFFASIRSDPERIKTLLAANRLLASDDTAMVDVAAPLTDMAAADSVRFTVLPVIATARGGDGSEEFRVDEATARLVYAELPENVATQAKNRARIGVTSGAGVTATTLGRLLRPVVPSADRVVLSSVADTAYDETLIVYYKDSQRQAADALRTSLGFGRVVWDPRDQDVVDLTLIVGADAARAPGAQAPPTPEQPAATDQPLDNTGSTP